MRIFVLCTGRCGSVTMIRACEHLTNFTVAHESRRGLTRDRFAYSPQHIEADNRLSWMLGGLEHQFGDEPLYIHLRRDPEQVAESFLHRWADQSAASIIRAFGHAILLHGKEWPEDQQLDVCRFYVETVTANIEAFLMDKPRQMTVWLEDAADWFPRFWDLIGGRGNLDAAMAEFETRHNAS